MSQRDILDKYIEQLSKSTRFKDDKGDYYDPVAGWNPYYRVLASDLKTIIPLNPFERLHKKPDISFGQPLSEPDYDPKGYMPYTWMQNGYRISANPILYELARARIIRNIYGELIDTLDSGKQVGMLKSKNLMFDSFKKYATTWRDWNKVLTEKQWPNNFKEDNVIFGDKFQQLVIDMRRKGDKKAGVQYDAFREAAEKYFSHGDHENGKKWLNSLNTEEEKEANDPVMKAMKQYAYSTGDHEALRK